MNRRPAKASAASRRGDVAHVALLVLAFNLFYKVLTDVLDWIGKAIDGGIAAAQGMDAAQTRELQSFTSSCVTLIYTVVGIVVVILVLRGPGFRRWLRLEGDAEAEVLVSCSASEASGSASVNVPNSRRITTGVLLMAFLLTFSTQTVFFLASNAIRFLTYSLNLTVVSTTGSIAGQLTQWPMFVAVSFTGPIMEELLYRGVVLRALRRYGRIFAIVTSATLFALMHHSFDQGIMAFFAGLVFGYVALEYSLGWSILLHILTNLLSAVQAVAAPYLSDAANAVIGWATPVIGVVAFVAFIALFRRKTGDYLRIHRSATGAYTSWCNVWFIAFAVWMIARACMAFAPMG